MRAVAEADEGREGAVSASREALAERVAARLWQPDAAGFEVFALLDGARDPRIVPLVRRSKLDQRCLFRGALHPRLAAAAPYLVNLAHGSRLTRDLLALGWGASWGVYLRSAAILQDLVRHFRQFLRAEDEAGGGYFFRFYDPRVLRVYLPTCTREELRRFFGPVERFSVEDEEDGTMLEYFLRGQQPVRRAVHLGV